MRGVLLAGWLVAAAVEKAEKFHEVCGVCHSEIAGDFVSHPHFENGLDCDSCHGESARHRASEGGSPPDRVAAGREIPVLCEACHQGEGPESIGKQFLESAHGRALASGLRAPQCGTCHGVHRVRPPHGVERGCKQCHDSLPSACGGTPRRSAPVSCAGCHEPHRFLTDGESSTRAEPSAVAERERAERPAGGMGSPRHSSKTEPQASREARSRGGGAPRH